MAPSIAFIFYRSVLWQYSFFRKRSTFVLLAIVVLCAAILLRHVALGMMLPLAPGTQNLMTMFSVAHYKEFLNSQLLSGGIGLFAYLSMLLFMFANRVKFTATHWFWLISSMSLVLFLFVVDAWRGSGDWDIYAFGAPVYNAMLAFMILDLHNRNILKNAMYGACMLAAFSIMHTTFWIASNASDASIKWLAAAFEKDPACYYKQSFNNESMLAAAYGANGLDKEAVLWSQKAYRKHRNDPRMGYNYANELLKRGQNKEAYAIYEELTLNFPQYALPYPPLISRYYTENRHDDLLRVLNQLQAAYALNPQAFTSRIAQEQIDSYLTLWADLRRHYEKK
jgi:hypothetical protein